MDIIDYFDSIGISEIEKMIAEKQEENLNLEFKTVNHPSYNDENRNYDKKNYSEAISGFANSNGGIVIWGVKAKQNASNQDVAIQLKPIKELTRFLNMLNRLEGQAVTPTVKGIIHKKIEVKNDEGFIKTFIPQSDEAPHMANFSGKHYYKRSGDSFYICEHFDIMDMIYRKKNAELDLVIKEGVSIDYAVYQGKTTRYEKKIAIVNTGKYFAKAPLIKIEINEPYRFSPFGLDGNGNIGLFKSRSLPSSPNSCTYLGGQDIIIYPGLLYEIDKIWLEIAKETKDLPDLVIDYTIVAENMEKITKQLTIKLI